MSGIGGNVDAEDQAGPLGPADTGASTPAPGAPGPATPEGDPAGKAGTAAASSAAPASPASAPAANGPAATGASRTDPAQTAAAGKRTADTPAYDAAPNDAAPNDAAKPRPGNPATTDAPTIGTATPRPTNPPPTGTHTTNPPTTNPATTNTPATDTPATDTVPTAAAGTRTVDTPATDATAAPADTGASTAHRVRSVLAIRAFRRLWGVTFLLSVADWLSLFALSSLANKLIAGYFAQSFAFSAVVLTQLLPGLLFAPFGGVLADRFDRRRVMVTIDLIRCALFLSIALVGTWWWLLGANFLIGSTAMMWIPAKDSAIPNLLKRKDQVETANQLGLVMTYGLAVVSAAGLFAVVTGLGSNLHLWNGTGAQLGVAKVIVIINGLLYLAAAIIVATRIPELSGRSNIQASRKDAKGGPGWFTMFSDGLRFARRTPLIRGLMYGMIGAFAAGGAVVGTAQRYATSLLGGDSTFSMLFVALFVGLGTGMAIAPRLARRMSHNRLFGIAIVSAGLALALVALSPHITVSLITVALVGACAGVAFLTGITIIGSQVEDAIRGRINALYQSLMKVVLFASALVVPLLVGLVKPHNVSAFGGTMAIDGTRPVMLGAGILAALAGVVAYRQMDDRSTEPIVANLVAALRRHPHRVKGMLIAVEGDTRHDTETQSRRLADWLRTAGYPVQLASDPALDESRLASVLSGTKLSGARAHVLVAAAVRADVVERRVLPALEAGEVVVMERYVDSPLAHLGALGGLDQGELEGLADWATGRIRPDVTVLLDRDPTTMPTGGQDVPRGINSVEHHWRVQRLLTEMASADPARYVVVDADGEEDAVADRVRAAMEPALRVRGTGKPGGGTPGAGRTADADLTGAETQ